jgi:2-hydroxychromene-2-carboxylate isomerase
MGIVISLEDRRRARARASAAAPAAAAPAAAAPSPAPTVLFDLASPGTYLAAERAERLLPGARWRPVHGDLLLPGPRTSPGRERAQVEARAAVLRLPLVWPERPPVARLALRVADLADERGRGAAFVLAACRLAWCGGFDLEDREVLAEAAAAAGLPPEEALVAADEPARDAAMIDEAGRLRVMGVSELPVVRVAGRLVVGEARLAEAAALARQPARAAPQLPRAT